MIFYIAFFLNLKSMFQIYTHLSIQASCSNLKADLMDTAGQDLRVFASKDDCCREKLITDLCCRFLTAVS